MTQTQTDWRRQIILFFVSQCITLFGSQIVQMAIVWYVTLQTDSGAWVAAISLCAYLPQFFVSFIGGVWADRYNKKSLIIGADVLIAVITLAMMLIMPRIQEESALLGGLLVMSLLRSAGAGVQNPAVNAAIAQMVPEEHLMRYNGINTAMQSVVQFGAPAVAAMVLTMGSLWMTLMIDVLSAAIGIGMFLNVYIPGRKGFQEKPAVAADIGTGLRYAYTREAVRKILIVYAVFVFLTVPAGYLSGLLVSRIFGDTYWYLTAVEIAGFGGMVLGGLLMGLWGGFKNRKWTLAAGLSLFGAMAIGMGLSRSLIPYLILMLLYGMALNVIQTTITTMLQETSEKNMQGRVFGLMGSLYSSCYPVGMALFGPLADRVPLQWIVLLSGMLLLLIGGGVYWDQS